MAVLFLRNEVEAQIDPEDLLIAQSYKWHMDERGYVRRTPSGKSPEERKKIRLHRLVMECKLGRKLDDNELVDHANRQPLDNRRANLRLASRTENNRNIAGRARSGYKGVYQRDKRFEACITVDRVRVYIGLYVSPREAAWMYDQWATELHGEFASLNFQYA